MRLAIEALKWVFSPITVLAVLIVIVFNRNPRKALHELRYDCDRLGNH